MQLLANKKALNIKHETLEEPIIKCQLWTLSHAIQSYPLNLRESPRILMGHQLKLLDKSNLYAHRL